MDSKQLALKTSDFINAISCMAPDYLIVTECPWIYLVTRINIV